jgi:hypothetical protein
MDYLYMTSLESGLPPVMFCQGVPNNAIRPNGPLPKTGHLFSNGI